MYNLSQLHLLKPLNVFCLYFLNLPRILPRHTLRISQTFSRKIHIFNFHACFASYYVIEHETDPQNSWKISRILPSYLLILRGLILNFTHVNERVNKNSVRFSLLFTAKNVCCFVLFLVTSLMNPKFILQLQQIAKQI